MTRRTFGIVLRPAYGWTLVEMMIAILIISILAALTLSIGSAVLATSETRQTEDALTLLDSALQEYAITQGAEPSYGINGEPLSDTGVGGRGSRYDINLQTSLDDGNGCACNGGLDPVLDYRESGLPSEEELVCSQWCQVAGCTGSGPDSFEGVAALFILQLQKPTPCRDIIRSINPDLLEQINVLTDDSAGVPISKAVRPVDAWGNPILIVFPGRDLLANEGMMGALRGDSDGTVRTKAEQMLGPAQRKHAYFVSAGPDGKFGNLAYDQHNSDAFQPDVVDVRFQETLDNLYSYEVQKW